MRTNIPISIAHIDREEIVRQFDRPDEFAYRPEKGWKWVQKLAIAFLRRIEAYAPGFDRTVNYVSKEISYDSFGDAALHQIHRLKMSLQEPTHILIGYKNRDLFVRELHETHCWSMPEFHYRVRNGRQVETETIYGLKILCVPSYEGPPLVFTDIP